MVEHRKKYDTTNKIDWRHQVWDEWRRLTGHQTIPAGLQYWTLGDVLLDHARKPIGELHAIQQYGLLEDMRSFISVCKDKGKRFRNLPFCECGVSPVTHDTNGCGHYRSSERWVSLHGPIEELVPHFKRNKAFHPALINLDTTHFPEMAWELAYLVGHNCGPGAIMSVNIITEFMGLRKGQVAQPGHRGLKCHIHDPKISYENGNCNLTTLFLIW